MILHVLGILVTCPFICSIITFQKDKYKLGVMNKKCAYYVVFSCLRDNWVSYSVC